jgi:peptide-methionine (S)-S-oxide reductase
MLLTMLTQKIFLHRTIARACYHHALLYLLTLFVVNISIVDAWISRMTTTHRWQRRQHMMHTTLIPQKGLSSQSHLGINQNLMLFHLTMTMGARDDSATRKLNVFMSSSTDIETSEQDLKQPSIGDVVSIECRLKPEFDIVSSEICMDGVRADEENFELTTLQFVLGGGNYIPSLHELIGTMKVGDVVTNQQIDSGYGTINPGLIATIAFDDTPGIDRSQIKIGSQLTLGSAMDATFRVTDVTNDTFTINGNSPFAGSTYLATVKLLSVESGPEPTEYTTVDDTSSSSNNNYNNQKNSRYCVATFALGCFWGGELEYMRVPGVVGTSVGYTQGFVENPSYEQTCSGTTGHTEAILVYYDPKIVSYRTLCDIALQRLGSSKYLLNQVGNDRGTQYRHGIYYHTTEQKNIAESCLQLDPKCVTECKGATKFYRAEDYHQQYLYKGGQSARKNDSSTIRCYG